ncbi:MAG: rRNA adenine dimethyltransferase family protein [Candidatus Liptonbacteria bacterium]|nr:rRNA adenine dimethyltransferase family protein [Candidatus Liptonbacteria bacterium]
MREKLGQYFLKSGGGIDKIIRELALGKETVIEIGSGHGALTKPLALALKEKGGRLVAIEKDPALAAEARGWKIENLEITEGDVLEVLPSLSRELPGLSYKLCGNIPYYLTGFLLRTIGELENKPELIVLTVQKEVAERLVSEPPKMNKLAASVRFWAEPKIISFIPRGDFNPPPNVDSAIISLQPKKRGGTDPARYYETVRKLFAQPRKTILNNLSAGTALPRQEATAKISSELAKLGLNPGARPQNLSVENIIRIASSEF